MQPFWSILAQWCTSSRRLDYLSIPSLCKGASLPKNPLSSAKQWGVISHFSERKRTPLSAGKLVTDWARGCAFLSAKPACSSMLLASPVLLKVPSGILSWFKSYFTCCSVVVFLGQHNAVGLFVFFFPYDICVLSPLFILLAQPYKVIVSTFIAMQMLFK